MALTESDGHGCPTWDRCTAPCLGRAFAPTHSGYNRLPASIKASENLWRRFWRYHEEQENRGERMEGLKK